MLQIVVRIRGINNICETTRRKTIKIPTAQPSRFTPNLITLHRSHIDQIFVPSQIDELDFFENMVNRRRIGANGKTALDRAHANTALRCGISRISLFMPFLGGGIWAPQLHYDKRDDGRYEKKQHRAPQRNHARS